MKGVYKPHGLTPARFDMLKVIDSEEYFYQRQLRNVLGVSGATVSRMLRSLRLLGLVETFVDPDDARCKCIVLTERGREVLKIATDVVIGSGLGGLAAASVIDWTNMPPRKTAVAGINELLRRLDCVRYGFGDRASLEYGRGPDD